MRSDGTNNAAAPGGRITAAVGRAALRRGQRRCHRPHRRGVIEIDVVAGLVIVGALTLALAAVVGRQHRAAQKLADTRAAVQLAETVLTDMQAGAKTPAAAPDPDVMVEVLPAALTAPGTAAGVARTGGSAAEATRDSWVEVVVTVRKGSARLVGPVPNDPAGGVP